MSLSPHGKGCATRFLSISDRGLLLYFVSDTVPAFLPNIGGGAQQGGWVGGGASFDQDDEEDDLDMGGAEFSDTMSAIKLLAAKLHANGRFATCPLIMRHQLYALAFSYPWHH